MLRESSQDVRRIERPSVSDERTIVETLVDGRLFIEKIATGGQTESNVPAGPAKPELRASAVLALGLGVDHLEAPSIRRSPIRKIIRVVSRIIVGLP